MKSLRRIGRKLESSLRHTLPGQALKSTLQGPKIPGPPKEPDVPDEDRAAEEEARARALARDRALRVQAARRRNASTGGMGAGTGSSHVGGTPTGAGAA